jgi:uncharacterized lipoprotein NlpE involved in copper resistance
MKNAIAAIILAVLMTLIGCTSQQAATSTAQVVAPAVHVKATTGQQEAFATKLRGLLMDNLALNMVVEATDSGAAKEEIRPDGYAVLAIRQEYMSEVLARQIMHSGLLATAQKMDFKTVRFETAGIYDNARVWQYRMDGTAQAGWRRCDTDYKQLEKYIKATQAQQATMKYPTTCTYKLDDGLAL